MNQQQSNIPSSDWLLGAITRNPEGLLLLAAGAALLMRKGASAFAASSAGQRVAEAASPQVDAIKRAATGATDYASDIAGRAKDTVDAVASSASRYADDARRTMGEQSGRAMHGAQSAFQDSVESMLKTQPLMVALVGMAAGAAVASAFPATDFEKDALGPVGGQVSEAASRITGQLKEAASNATEILKSSVDKHGLNADGLKEVATEVAGAFTSSIKGDTAKDTPASGSGRSSGGQGQGGQAQGERSSGDRTPGRAQ